ncbi:uncharacterized protein LOC119190434 [Manduca sexta]|uniref:uncharacterized protein LOC119190434 n=1 Tax=Manduca sexta TaxID=7130 RepID=UPI00188E6813|nr:uncharacterized protein LOC119190434 [Manduca sexta]
MKSSPINALQVECVESPLRLRRQYLSDKFLLRTLQFSNPPLLSKLCRLNEQVRLSKYWVHKSWPCLVKSLQKFQAIEAPTHNSQYLPIYSTNFDSLLLSPNICFNLGIQEHVNYANSYLNYLIDKNWPCWHQIYTDASKHTTPGCVGVGVYHVQYKIVQKIKLPPESSVFTGECFGLLKAIEYILMMKLANTVIFTDSKSALQALARFPFKHNFFTPLIMQIRTKLHHCYLKKYSVTFAWVPSHCGVKGNEKADELANQAVDCGDLFPYKNYSHDLAALPRVHLRESWSELWTSSGMSKGKFYYLIQPTIPLRPWFCGLKLGKTATSVLIRMRLGHVCTPARLARLGIVESSACSCGCDVGDLNHLIFSCPNHDHSSLYSSLSSLGVPFPTNICTLLCNYNIDIYRILSVYISINNIKV